MKHCKRSHKCPYGNAFEKNVCAYDKNLNFIHLKFFILVIIT